MKTIGKYLAILIAVVLLWNQVILKPFRFYPCYFTRWGMLLLHFFSVMVQMLSRLHLGQWETQWLAHKGGSFFYDIQRRIFGKYIVFLH